jgi:hypothetical protein
MGYLSVPQLWVVASLAFTWNGCPLTSPTPSHPSEPFPGGPCRAEPTRPHLAAVHAIVRPTRWRVAAAAAATAVAMCVPAVPTQALVGDGVSARSEAVVVATTGGFSGGRWGDRTADHESRDAHGTYRAEKDPGSLCTMEKAIGARGLWARPGGPLTGQGVSVAVLDSGVSAVAGLDGAGKVTYGRTCRSRATEC